MGGFQIAGLGLIAGLVIITAAHLARARLRSLSAWWWLVVWLLAGYAIAVPDITREVAHMLGIQRGADLVFYSAVLGALVGFFVVFLRMRRLERHTTLLVRELALHTGRAAAEGPHPRPTNPTGDAKTGPSSRVP